ncbi:TPA: 4-hydroxy-tetrahydrodipicolinate reductase [bacterium]|nr:4-hydroxy-tetrahydrodipicolinate reductase [bacterium]
MIKVIISGTAGRMGSKITKFILQDPEIELVGAIECAGHPSNGCDAAQLVGEKVRGITLMSDEHLEDLLDEADILIEFTNPEATLSHLKTCFAKGKGMVIGTTGFNDEQLLKIKEASLFIPILISPNMSLGVNLLFDLAPKIAQMLGEGYDIEIIEAHHHHKKDAPSGTAIRLGELIATSLDRELKDIAVYGRQGLIGERNKQEIGFSTIRAGDIVGEHTVLFCTEGERIELTHRAHSRDTFVRGAIQAAKFLSTKAPGYYSMTDVLSI